MEYYVNKNSLNMSEACPEMTYYPKGDRFVLLNRYRAYVVIKHVVGGIIYEVPVVKFEKEFMGL